MYFYIALLLPYFCSTFATGQTNVSENYAVPEIPQSKLTVYNNSIEEFYACFKLESNKTICANSSETHVQITKGDGEVVFDIRETPKYEFRRIGNISLVKFKNEKKEKRLLVNNLIFDSPEQVDPSYLADIDENEFEKQAKELMMNGDVDSMVPLADSIDKLELNREQQKAARPILTLAMNTLRAESSLKTTGKLKMNESKYLVERSRRRRKRSVCLWGRQPIGDNCLGMCGPGCWLCWWYICGDCCYHQGCYEHDVCCRDFISSACLSPLRLVLRFSCSGYPNCGKPPSPPSSSRGCFPAEATVQRKNSKAGTSLKDIRIGDEVLTVNDEGMEVYTKVIMFLDHKPQSLHTYLRVHFTDGQSLAVSKRHLVFKQERENAKVAVYAEEIAVGDYLFKYSGHQKSLQALQVVSVDETQRYGAYAPLTEKGTLLVDGVFSSCYAEIRSHHLAHFALSPLRLWKSWFPSKKIQQGVHSYAQHLQNAVEWFKPLLPKQVSDVLG